MIDKRSTGNSPRQNKITARRPFEKRTDYVLCIAKNEGLAQNFATYFGHDAWLFNPEHVPLYDPKLPDDYVFGLPHDVTDQIRDEIDCFSKGHANIRACVVSGTQIKRWL